MYLFELLKSIVRQLLVKIYKSSSSRGRGLSPWYMVHHYLHPRSKQVHVILWTPPFGLNIIFKVMYKRIIVVVVFFNLALSVRDISQMAMLSNSKICTLYVTPRAWYCHDDLLIQNREKAIPRASRCLISFFALGKSTHLI